MSNLVSELAKAIGCRASAARQSFASINARRNLRTQVNVWDRLAAAIARTAIAAGTGSVLLASVVLVAAVTPAGTAFAAPVGAAGPSPALKPVTGDDPPVTLNFNIGGYTGSASLMTSNVGGGNFLATSGTLTMTTTIPGSLSNTYCLVAAAPPAGSVSTSILGAFLYDNVLTPGANPAFPTIYGLLFSNRAAECGGNYTGQDEINIWATNAPPGTPGHYSFYNFRDGTGYTLSYDTPANGNDSFNAAVATTTYSYSGRAFNRFACSPNDCTSPPAGSPYATTSSVTVAVQLAAPLCAPADASAGSCSTAPVNLLCSQNVVNQNFVSMTLNDGVNTVRTTDCNAGATAWVKTDVNGNINGWYLDATASGGQDIQTLYDPTGAIAGACNACYSASFHGNPNSERDYGQFLPPSSQQLVYAYNLGLHGSFTPGYNGGTTTADDCKDGQSCTLVPGSTFTILGPNAQSIPDGALLTEQECVVPADPRGPNCGAVNGRGARTLNVSDLPQCKGFGNEVIPDYLCGASGSSGTGFALILGNAEQIDTFNGTYGDSELDVEQVPDLKGSATNPTCPKNLSPGTLPIRTSALAAVGTRSGSLVEEQTPEQTFDGRPLLIEMTSSCDPPKSNHGPGLTLEGMGFKLRTEDPGVVGGLTRNQRLLVFANYKYLNLDAVMLLTKFPTSSPTRKNLQNCINKSQTLLNSGPSHYICAAEQVYQCEQIVESTDFHQFGPTSGPPLRLPDPYGDIVRRLGNLYYTINTRINLQAPNVDWPLPVSTGHPAGDPYPGQCH